MKLLSSTLLLAATPALAQAYSCELPTGTSMYSVITEGDAYISPKTVYSGVAVGGTLHYAGNSTSTIIGSNNPQQSYMDSLSDPTSKFQFKPGKTLGADLDSVIDFGHFQYLAENAKSSTINGKKVVVLTSGGTFNTYNFNNGGQGEDNGNTLVIFNTDQDVTLTKTNDGRQFGPSVIAPFSTVRVLGNAGFVDGFIVAKEFITDSSASNVQLHGDTYTGGMECNAPPPTSAPPTSGPTSAPTPSVPDASPSGSLGDPHFRTWRNEHFEYHGQCDLVLTKDETFADGLGLEVQIRTKLVRFWSYIKGAAIRIGNDILEVEGISDAEAGTIDYWINLEYQGELKTLGGFPVSYEKMCRDKFFMVIDLSSKFPGQSIEISAYKEFLRVDFKNGSAEAFGNTVGLLGDFNNGKTLARDGTTVMDVFAEFGNEWQVLPTENMLFHEVSEPQFPKKCIEPEDPRGERRRRLDESSVTEEQAEAACGKLNDESERKDCVYDILATQDLDMVGAY